MALSILALAIVPASAAEPWTQVRSKNFHLIGDAAEKDILQTAARLEQFREAIRQLFPQVRLDGGVRTNVVVFKNEESYLPFRPRGADGTPDTAITGYFLAGDGVNYITLSAGDKPGAYSVIFHEYVHYLLDANIGRSDIPPWLGEGLAEYLETMQVLPDGRRVTLGTPPNGHLAVLKQNGLIPLKTFFTTDNSSLHRGVVESRGWFYAQAWLLTHYLFHGGRTPVGGQLNTLLSTIKNSDSSEKASAMLYGSDLAALEERLKAYIDSRPLAATTITLDQALDIRSDTKAAPLPESAMAAYLGDLHYHAGRPAEAETLLRRAVRLDEGSAMANMSLGLVLTQKRNFADARRYLEKAAAAAPADYLVQYAYAYGLSRESLDEGGRVYEFPAESEAKMRRALLRSIELNPGFAESCRLLAFVDLVNDSGLDEAARLLQKALAIRPGDQGLDLLLAKILLRQEKFEEARVLARKLSATAATSQTWSEAREILRTVEQYYAAKAAGPADPALIRAFGPIPPLILKRSSITDLEAARYDEERELININLYIERPRFGEKQTVGYVDKIACSDGTITYSVNSAGESFKLTSGAFAALSLRVLTPGERSFTFDCGGSFGKQLVVMIYEPTPGAAPGVRGRLRSIAFVPAIFRLKTPEELAARRLVIIEDDRPQKQREASLLRSRNPQN